MDQDWDKAVKLYKKAVSKLKEVDCKGKTMPYTSANGYMFSFIDKDGIIHIRLGKDELKAFIEKHKSKGTEQYGHKMKEFAVVPEGLYTKTKELSDILKQGRKYVLGLKPKKEK